MPVASMSMRLRIGWHPHIGEPGNLQLLIELGDEFFRGHARDATDRAA
jgi:hypothetical protein